MRKISKYLLMIITISIIMNFCGCENGKEEDKNKSKDDIVVLENNASKAIDDHLTFKINKGVEKNEIEKDIVSFKNRYKVKLNKDNVVEVKDNETKNKKYSIEKIQMKDKYIKNKFCTNNGSDIFFLGYDEDKNMGIMKTNLSGKIFKVIELKSKDNIDNFYLLQNESIIFSGIYNNESGVFYYNSQNKEISKMLNGKNIIFTISPDERKIVYSILESKNKLNLYGAKFNENKLLKNDLIYENVSRKSLNLNDSKWNVNSKILLIKKDKSDKENYAISFDEGTEEIEMMIKKFITFYYTVDEEVYKKYDKVMNDISMKTENAFQNMETALENDVKVYKDDKGCMIVYNGKEIEDLVESINPYVNKEFKTSILRWYPYNSWNDGFKFEYCYEPSNIEVTNIALKDDYIECNCKFQIVKKSSNDEETTEKEMKIGIEYDVDRWVINEHTELGDQ
ncbi:hypothetical protein [Clostridium ihumii]|uniref:hypothetical protein n=1 Tax=Clostridium ihumii TaxID=1470356 RepID=UPI003D32A15C